MTDEQWALIKPLLPAPHWDGRPDKHPRREVVDAIMYVVRTGCSWRQLPVDFPPWQTVYWHFVRWEDQGVTQQMVDVLRRRVRKEAGRKAEPSAAVLDSQSVKGADTVGADNRGCDANKKINGRNRFVIVHIVAKPADQRGFRVHPRRWVVERALAWLMAYRRLVRDYEHQPPTSEAMIRWAVINMLARRITRGHPAQRPGPRPLKRAHRTK
ncbi:IS5 family transposase [Streptosporangium amethystogenes]|uniref:IS5 family transposase n=1 Tax=Streptosporangium amethystogenes TaxID=2002 RepID=UPI00378A4A65